MRIMGLAEVFRRMGWSVCLIVPDRPSQADLTGQADRLEFVKCASYPGGPLTAFDASPFAEKLESVLRELAPDIIIAEYAWMAPVLGRVPPGVGRWVDCHDVLHERTRRFSALGLDPWVQCTAEEESALLRYADLVICTQQREERILRRLLPGKRIHCLLPPVGLPAGFRPYSVQSPLVITVGSDHAGNCGIRQFVDVGWPEVVARNPASRLLVIGGISKHITKRDSVIPVESCDISRHYRSAAIVVCPITVGTGIKIKMIEALRFGKAVVATRAAAEGMPETASPAWITTGSIRQTADEVSRLLADRGARAELESRAFSYGRRYFSHASAVRSVRSLLCRETVGRRKKLPRTRGHG